MATPTLTPTGTPTAIATPTPSNTGARRPYANQPDAGGDNNGFEVSPESAYTNGSGYARNMDGVGDRHRYYNYHISLPSNSRINGIIVRADWYPSATPLSPQLGVELSWDAGVSWTQMQLTPAGRKNERSDSLGAASDLWGRTWTAAELQDANFRVRVTSLCSDAGQCGAYDYYLDWLPVTVYYTP